MTCNITEQFFNQNVSDTFGLDFLEAEKTGVREIFVLTLTFVANSF